MAYKNAVSDIYLKLGDTTSNSVFCQICSNTTSDKNVTADVSRRGEVGSAMIPYTWTTPTVSDDNRASDLITVLVYQDSEHTNFLGCASSSTKVYKLGQSKYLHGLALFIIQERHLFVYQ